MSVLDRLAEPQNMRVLIVTLLALVVIAVVGASWAVVQASHSAERAEVAFEEQREGRRVGLKVICAFGNAIAGQGRRVITASARPPKPGSREARFIEFLESKGYAPLRERQAAAVLGGAAYVQGISEAVEDETGLKGIVVQRGPLAGTLDCKALELAARTLR